jgi:hypothetical protein
MEGDRDNKKEEEDLKLWKGEHMNCETCKIGIKRTERLELGL